MTDNYKPKVGHEVSTWRGVEKIIAINDVSGCITEDAVGWVSDFQLNEITYLPRHKVNKDHPNYAPGFDEPWDNPDNPAYDEYWAQYKPLHAAVIDNEV